MRSAPVAGFVHEFLEGIDHVGVVVEDIDEALEAHRESLGLEVVHREVLPELGASLAYLDVGNAYLQLVAPISDAGQFLRDFLEEHGEGLHHVCFSVSDIHRAIGSLGDGAAPYVGGRGQLACFLSARPTGIRVELTESRAAGPTSP